MKIIDDRAEETRREESGPEGTGCVLADGRQQPQSGSHRCGHAINLPADLFPYSLCPIRRGEASGLRGICGGTEGMGAHMADRGRLTGGSGRGRCSRSLHLTCTDATGKPPANLLGGVELSPGERAGPGDERPRAVIIWSLRLKQPEHPLCAVSGPCGNKTSVGFAERLWRPHHPIALRPAAPPNWGTNCETRPSAT